MTGHVAHQDVSRWAGEAFDQVAKPGARLYHAVFPTSLADEWLEKLSPFDIFRPGTPNVVPDEEMDLYFELPARAPRPEDRLDQGARQPDRGALRGLR